jgi:hypothetical protein
VSSVVRSAMGKPSSASGEGPTKQAAEQLARRQAEARHRTIIEAAHLEDERQRTLIAISRTVTY